MNYIKQPFCTIQMNILSLSDTSFVWLVLCLYNQTVCCFLIDLHKKVGIVKNVRMVKMYCKFLYFMYLYFSRGSDTCHAGTVLWAGVDWATRSSESFQGRMGGPTNSQSSVGPRGSRRRCDRANHSHVLVCSMCQCVLHHFVPR